MSLALLIIGNKISFRGSDIFIFLEAIQFNIFIQNISRLLRKEEKKEEEGEWKGGGAEEVMKLNKTYEINELIFIFIANDQSAISYENILWQKIQIN